MSVVTISRRSRVPDETNGSGMGQPHRLVFIDNLRWSAISMVVVLHAAVTYSGIGSWYVHDRAGTSRPLVVGLGTYQNFQHSVAMGLLFGIAGYFARASVEKKGTAGFLKERAFRLGLPLLLYALVVGPATQYFIVGSWHSALPQSFAREWLHHIADGEVFSESGPLWFCLVLLAFSVCYALGRQFFRSTTRHLGVPAWVRCWAMPASWRCWPSPPGWSPRRAASC